jgi:hypothetical protein
MPDPIGAVRFMPRARQPPRRRRLGPGPGRTRHGAITAASGEGQVSVSDLRAGNEHRSLITEQLAEANFADSEASLNVPHPLHWHQSEAQQKTPAEGLG